MERSTAQVVEVAAGCKLIDFERDRKQIALRPVTDRSQTRQQRRQRIRQSSEKLRKLCDFGRRSQTAISQTFKLRTMVMLRTVARTALPLARRVPTATATAPALFVPLRLAGQLLALAANLVSMLRSSRGQACDTIPAILTRNPTKISTPDVCRPLSLSS